MRRTAFHIVLFLLVLLVTRQVSAQMMFDTLTLEQFEVIALQQDYASAVKKVRMDSMMMREMKTKDLSILLASYSPVAVRSYGNGSLATVSFRGTAASHIKVLWNGFSINSSMLGSVDFSLIPNSFFNRVELYYGGASLTGISGGLGGSVLLENNSEWTKKPSVDIEQLFGSFHSLTTTAGLTVGTEKFGSDTRIFYRSSKNDFPYYNNAVTPPDEMIQENASIMNGGFQQQFGFSINSHNKLTIITWNQWNDQDIPPLMTNVDKGGNQKETLKEFFSRNSVEWRWQKEQNKLVISGAGLYDNMNYRLQLSSVDDTSGTKTLIDSKNKTATYSVKAKYTREFKKGFMLDAGTDAVFERVNSNNYDNLKTRNTINGYGNLVKNFKKRLRLNLLMRFEMTDGKLLPVMPLFGINYRLLKNEKIYLRASISRNYHLPSLNDLYWSPGGNPDLKAEDGMEIEGGANFIKQLTAITIGADFTGYASRINNWIQWVPGDYQYWTPRNITKVFTRGFETSFHLQGQNGHFSYYAYAGYAFTRTTNEKDGNANQLIYIPVHSANAFLHAGFKGFYLGWNTHFTGKRNTSPDGEDAYLGTVPGYVLNDLSAGKTVKMKLICLDFRFRINNVFNEEYQAVLWRAMPGRNYEISIRFNLN